MSETDMAQRIKDLRTSQHLTLEQIANKVGVGKSTVRKWETGMIANMRRDKIAKLAQALNTTPAYLMGWNDAPEASAKGDPVLPFDPIPVGSFVRIPVIGRVRAGAGGIAEEEFLGYEIAANLKNSDEYRYFKVEGDSMSPRIEAGDLALVHIQPEVENGELAVVIVDGEEGLIKKIQLHEGGAISLVSFNPNYPPRLLMGKELKELTIWGKVIKIERSF